MTRTNCPSLPDAVSAPRPEERSKPLRRADGQFLYRECPLSAPLPPSKASRGGGQRRRLLSACVRRGRPWVTEP